MAQHGKYVVHVTTDDPPIYYDNDGKGYTFSGAVNFGRIGSQRGEDRAITRGTRGAIVRVYQHGERLWPLYARQVNALSGAASLTPREMPKMLIFEGSTARTVLVKKVGKSYRAVPKSEPWRSRFLNKHPRWK